jgi:hypothetical protein
MAKRQETPSRVSRRLWERGVHPRAVVSVVLGDWASPYVIARISTLESRMMGNYRVPFGGGPMEKYRTRRTNHGH